MLIVDIFVVCSHVGVKIPLERSRLGIFPMVIRKSLNRRLSDLGGRLLGMNVCLYHFIRTFISKVRIIVQIVDKVIILFLESLFKISLVELDLVR